MFTREELIQAKKAKVLQLYREKHGSTNGVVSRPIDTAGSMGSGDGAPPIAALA